MDDLAQEIAVIRDELTPEWDDERNDRLFAGVGRTRRRRRIQRITAASALGAAAAVALVIGVQQLAPRGGNAGELAGRNVPVSPTSAPLAVSVPAQRAAAVAVTRVRAEQRVHLSDGSTAQTYPKSELDVLKNEPTNIGLRLVAGRARFDVVPDSKRSFTVDAGPVQVAVIGTVFEVEREGGRVRVGVTEGKVRVHTPEGLEFVAKGDSVWFDEAGVRESDFVFEEPIESTPRPSAREHGGSSKARRQVGREDSQPSAASVSWRSLCQSGDYDAAYRLLENGAVVDNAPAALMDAADAARLSGHAEASVSYLRRVLGDHARSPVAPLAGFTLGRVLLERLGQPSEAAEAFALARSSAPNGSLAQDALAREVEAWSKAGKSHEAYQRAQLYVQTYPNGRRLRAVRLYGGLE